MKLLRPWMHNRRAKRIYRIVLVLFVLFNILIFLVLPPVARRVAASKASKALGRRVTIEAIRVNPYALSLTIRGIRISDRDVLAEFVSIGRVYVRAKAASIWKLAPVIGAVHVDDPMIRIIREDASRFNFSDLTEPKKEEKKPAGKPFRFSFNDIQVHNGRVLYEDIVSGREHALEEIEVAVPSVSNFAYYVEKDVQPHFSAQLDGSLISLDGTCRPFADSLQTTVALDLNELDLSLFAPEAPMPLNFKVPSGKLSLGLTLTYIQLKEGKPSLSVNGDVLLSDFVVADLAGRPVLRLPEVRLTGISTRPLAGQAYLKELLIREPELDVARSRDGKVNLLGLLPPAAPTASAKPSPSENGGSKSENAPMAVDVDRVELRAGKVTFTDEAAASAFKTVVSPIDLQVTNFTTARGGKSDYAFTLRTESDEALSLKGSFSVAAKTLTANVNLSGPYLPKYAPYYSDFVRASVRDGRLTLSGDVAAAQVNGALHGSFTGRAALENLAVLDPAGEELLKWDALSFNGIKVALPPAAVDVGEVLLDKLRVLAVRNADGSINLAAAVAHAGGAAPAADAAAPAPASAAAPEPAKGSAAPAVTVGKIALRDGRVEFRDRSLEPNFNVSLDAMNLSLLGFALDPEKQSEPGRFQFDARLDNQTPISLSGRLNPSREDRLVDLTVALHGVQLGSFTPYSDKFAGYPVTKGSLVVDVKCLIRGDNLSVTDHILLDQLTLGDHVDSPTATKLPVKFALALLRDRHGRITLDVPISHTLSDPKFRVWPFVMQTVVNLVEKAVTSPFAFLFQGKEEMRFVEFDYGSDTLNSEAAGKLDEIAKLLADRPALRMDIQPQMMGGADEEALRRRLVERKVRLQKLKETAGRGGAAALEGVQVAPGEYERYLKLAYEAADIPEKPRNFIGVAKDVPREQMEKMLLAHTEVTQDDLRRLAYARASSVRDRLLGAQAADAVRLFLAEPERVAAAEGRPRVNFELQLGEGGPAPAQKPFAPPPASPRERISPMPEHFPHFLRDTPGRP